MLPRRGHRSAGPRRAADWPPPGSRTLTTLPLLVMMMVMLSSVCAAEDEPRLLGCLTASLDQLLRRAAFSTPADTAADCFRICGQQEAPLAAVRQRWCFCLDQQLGAEELDADCSSPPPDGQQLVRVHALEKLADLTEADEVHQAQAPAEPSNPLSSLSQSLMVGTLHLEPVRCAATITEYNDTPKQVDMCVHTCSTQFSTGFVAMGPSMGSSEQYECHCTADDEFGASLSDDTCNQPCMRFGEELHDTLCGGFTANGSTALSVYRLVDDEPGSTPTPVTTRRSTGHSAPASGITDSACPDGGVQVDDRGCYRPEAVTGDITRPDDPRTYEEAVEACDRLSNSGWRPWAIETQEERDRVFQVLLIEMGFLQDTDDVVTSGTVQADGSTVRWADWPGDPDADWLDGLTSGTPQPGYVLIWGNIQGPSAAGTTLQYYKPDELPNPLAVICELPLAGTTAATTTETTTPSPTSTEPTTTAAETTTPTPTSTEATTTPDVTSPSTTTSLPSTHKPRPVTPDDVINDLIDSLNGTTTSNVTESDVIDTVDQLDDILAAQVNMSSHLPPPERLASDTQFTIDMVQLVDTLLSATDAWSNMTQDQLEETSSQLMASTEATGFLLAASAAAAGSSDVIEAVQPRLVLSASAVDRSRSGAGFRFPSESADASSWIELPDGYLDSETDPNPDLDPTPDPEPGPRPDPESDWVQQVGVLYRTELMERILSPSNNSMDDAGKRLNSEVLSFSLGTSAGRVPLAGAGARLHMGYALVEREPAQREVWRYLHAGEEPSAVRGSAVCTYWNYTHSQWATDGCHLETSSSSKHHATCVCTHLTSFSILMDYHDYVGTPESLNILTWVLGSLSLVGLVITWIVFTCNRSLRCTRTTITRNLCGTYAIGLLLLLTVMDRRLVYLAPGACTVAGMAIHYSFLAVFAWTMVEGIHLYKVLRHVFEPKSNSMTRYYMYGYLVPALIIIATNTVALAVDQYAYVRDEFCWLTIPYFIWFYNGPIGVVLILNMFVLILAYRSAASLKVNQLRAKSEKMKRWLKGWFSLSCLLGVQWAIGYIYVDGSNFFDYVFTALNCSQGLLIFIFHCVLREKTRQILLGRFSTNKRSTMMNSVYGQMVIAERKKQEYRQSRMSHDTCVTQLSNSPSPANSESPDSSPASERSSSSSQGSGSSKTSSAGSGSRKGRPSLTRGVSADSRCTNSSLRGRVNLAFQPDEPWAPLPDISEETDGAGSPRRGPGPVPVPGRGSRGAHPPPARHPALAEMYRSHSVAALRHGKAH